MIRHKRSTVLALTLLSITLSTTSCIQKQEIPVKSTVHQAPQQLQQLGAQTLPYKETSSAYVHPAVQYTQPTVQYTQPAVQYTQPAVQYTQPAVQYTQPAVQYVSPVQQSVQYTEPQLPTYEEEEGCSDDISTNTNNCDRGSIDKSQLSSNYIQESSSGGTMHSFKSVQGSSIKIGERKNGFTFPNHPGKVVIIEMFGRTCPHCIKEIPTLKKLKRKYGSKLEVIGIHSQGIMGKSNAQRFISQYRVNYPIIDSTNATDLQYFIQNTYGWTGVLPFTMVIKDGVTEGSLSGEASYKELKEIIDPLF